MRYWPDFPIAITVCVSPDSRQCRHCPALIGQRVQYPGFPTDPENRENRLAGIHPERITRTEEQRRMDNDGWTRRHDEITGRSLRYRAPSPRTASTPPLNTANARTGVVGEVDNRADDHKYRCKSDGESGLPVFFHPPCRCGTGCAGYRSGGNECKCATEVRDGTCAGGRRAEAKFHRN